MKIEYTKEEVDDILRDHTVMTYHLDLSGKQYIIDSFGYRWSIEIFEKEGHNAE